MSYSNNISSHVNASRFTAEEKRFIRTAMADPNIDIPTGVPDDIAENTVVKKVVQEFVINMHDYAATDGTQVDVISWPYLRPMKLTDCTIGRETEVTIPGDTDLLTGGVGVYVNKEDESPFYSNESAVNFSLPINTTGGMANAGQIIYVSDEFLGGRCRMLGRSIKVVNEGPETYQSGTVRAWEQPIPPSVGNYMITESSIKTQNEADAQVSRVRVETEHIMAAPVPASNQQQQNLRRTKLIGHAKDGVFMVDAVDFNNSTTTPVKRDIIFDEGSQLTVASGDQIGEYNRDTANNRNGWIAGRLVAAQYNNYKLGSTSVTDTVTGQNPRNYYMGNRLRGIRFSGLNTGKDGAPGPAVLRIVVTTFLEQIPSNRDANMASLAKKSPDPNPKVLDFLYDLQAKMDFAFQAKVNGLGQFTSWITKLLSTSVPQNKLTKAFDKSGISQKAKNFMLTKGANIPGVALGVQAAKYADAVATKSPKRKAMKNKLKKEMAIDILTSAVAGPAIGSMIDTWKAASNEVGWLASAKGVNWAKKMWEFHKTNPDYRFSPKLWADVMQVHKLLTKRN